MRREEEEMHGKLNKFLSSNPKPDTSSMTEEDEEEETFSIDLEKNMVTQKVGEGVMQRDADGTMHEVKDPNVVEMVEEKVKEVAEPLKPTLQVKYGDMITERFVSKAIASIIERLVKIQKESGTIADEAGLSYIGDMVGDKMFETIQSQKNELRAAIAGGKIHYDKIPDWAKSYIDDHVNNALNTLIDLAERD
jgi:hypothetical protein